MIIKILFIIISFLFSVQNSNHKTVQNLEFVEETDPIANLIERLYLSSKILPNEMASFYTVADAEENFIYWKITSSKSYYIPN